jgi:hypothetical protein
MNCLWPNSRYYSIVYLKILRKIMKIFSHRSLAPYQDLNSEPLRWEAEMLPTKVKLSLCLQGVWRSGGMDPHILDFGIGGEWSASRISRSTPGETAPRRPSDRRLGEPQNQSGRQEEGNISLSGLWTPCRPSRSHSLYRLRYHRSSSSKVSDLFSQDWEQIDTCGLV